MPAGFVYLPCVRCLLAGCRNACDIQSAWAFFVAYPYSVGNAKAWKRGISSRFSSHAFFIPARFGNWGADKKRDVMKITRLLAVIIFSAANLYAGTAQTDTTRLHVASKPVPVGKPLRVSFTIYTNQKGDLKLPGDLKGLEILLGPAVSRPADTAACWTTYTYIFNAPEAGFYLLEPAVWEGETGRRVVSEPVLLEVQPKRAE